MTLIKGVKYKVKIYGEIHCEECNIIEHNHFECPDCYNKYASTDIYHDISDESVGALFSCEECGTLFKFITNEYPVSIVEYIGVDPSFSNRVY